jgi:uncharacterized protein YrrD
LNVLISTKALQGMGIKARDGVFGKIDDVFFDDRIWNVQYIVVNTSSWLPGRKVLLPRGVLESLQSPDNLCAVTLTKDEIKSSPPIAADEPVSRRYETSLLEYLRLVPYWRAEEPAASFETGAYRGAMGTGGGEPTLRSCREVRGYRVEAGDGEIGQVDDFITDDRTWVLRYAVVDTRKWLPGRKVLVAIPWMKSVSWAGSKVRVDLTREEIEGSPEFDPRAPINREYESVLYDYYGRPRYWGEPGRK